MRNSFSIEEDNLIVKEKEFEQNNYVQPKYEQQSFNDNIFENKYLTKILSFSLYL